MIPVQYQVEAIKEFMEAVEESGEPVDLEGLVDEFRAYLGVLRDQHMI